MATPKFNLNDLLNQESSRKENSNKYQITMLSVYDLVPSTENFYSTENVEDLKQSIEMNGAIKQNLIVTDIGEGKYRIIAGHRRHKASLLLAEEGKKEFEKVPCIIEKELDEDKEQLLLIMTNSSTRVLTDYEKTKQAEKLKDILVKIKKKENLTGRVRDLIADILKTSSTNVARMESISKKLTPELKEEFKKEKIGITKAYELSKKPKEEQKEIHNSFKDTGKLEVKKEDTIETPVIEEQEQSEFTSYYHIEKGKEKYFIGEDVTIRTTDGGGRRGIITHITCKGLYINSGGKNDIHFNFKELEKIIKL